MVAGAGRRLARRPEDDELAGGHGAGRYRRAAVASGMTVAAQMLDTHPADLGGLDKQKLVACIEACVECAQSCTACADADRPAPR